jgi:hypothetical protein
MSDALDVFMCRDGEPERVHQDGALLKIGNDANGTHTNRIVAYDGDR